MLPHTEYIHYLIHRQAKQPEPEVHKVLQDVSNEVNFIKMAFKYTVFCTERWPWKIFSFFIWHRGLLATSGKLYKRIAELNVDMNFFFFLNCDSSADVFCDDKRLSAMYLADIFKKNMHS